jgi:hypothetical protein
MEMEERSEIAVEDDAESRGGWTNGSDGSSTLRFGGRLTGRGIQYVTGSLWMEQTYCVSRYPAGINAAMSHILFLRRLLVILQYLLLPKRTAIH